MPIPKIYGGLPSVVDAKKIGLNPASKAASPPIVTDRWYRNGLHPDASAFSLMNEAQNQALLYRTKEVFSMPCALGLSGGIWLTSSGVAARARHRFAFRTAYYNHALLCRVLLYPQSTGYDYDAYTKLEIANGAGTIVKTAEFHYGAYPARSATAGTWSHLRVVDKWITGLTANTEYYGTFSDVNYGRMVTACVAELHSATEKNNGYMPQNFTSETEILDVYRQNLVTPLPNIWKYSGAKVFNWSVDDGTAPRTRASSTAVNPINMTSTTVATTTPGFTVNMTGKARLAQSSGVPVTLKAFCSTTAVGGQGRIYLKDSGGTAVLQVTDGIPVTTPGWVSATGYLPASAAKYDLQFDNNSSGTISLYAVSVYEYEA